MITKKYQVLTLQQQEVHCPDTSYDPDEITFYTPTSKLLNTYEEPIKWLRELEPGVISEQHFIIQEVSIVS